MLQSPKKTGRDLHQAYFSESSTREFGNLAVMARAFALTVDPWLCVTGFRRFYLYRTCLKFY